jgi:hypothetical protein
MFALGVMGAGAWMVTTRHAAAVVVVVVVDAHGLMVDR